MALPKCEICTTPLKVRARADRKTCSARCKKTRQRRIRQATHLATPLIQKRDDVLTSAAPARPLRIGALCAGYSGLEIGVRAALGAGEVAWFSEIDDAPSKILAHHYPAVPNLGDLTQIDWASLE